MTLLQPVFLHDVSGFSVQPSQVARPSIEYFHSPGVPVYGNVAPVVYGLSVAKSPDKKGSSHQGEGQDKELGRSIHPQESTPFPSIRKPENSSLAWRAAR